MRGPVFDLQASLANGFRFWSFRERLELGIFEFILKHRFPPLAPCCFSPCPEQVQALADPNRRAKDEYKHRLAILEPTLGKHFAQIVFEVNSIRESDFVRVLRAILLKDPIPENVWEYASGLGQQISHLEPRDLECLFNWVRDGNWIKSPYLMAHAKLWAAIEPRRKVKPNDDLDILRLSVALADADVIFCDNPMESAIRQSKLDREFPTVRVFGNQNLNEGIAYLDSL